MKDYKVVCLTFIVFVIGVFALNWNDVYRNFKIMYFEQDVNVDREMVYDAANQMLTDMSLKDTGFVEKYEFGSLTECMLVYQYLEKNILLGNNTKPVIRNNKNKYQVGWTNGIDISSQHEKAKEYVDGLVGDKQMNVMEINEFIKSLGIQYDEERKNRTVYDLLDGANKGTCTVYSSLFKYLCDKNNIDCEVIIGESGGDVHVWNCVDSKHYYDLTGYCETGDDRFLDLTKDNYEKLYYEYTDYEIAVNVGLNYRKE